MLGRALMQAEHKIIFSFAGILIVSGALALGIQQRDRLEVPRVEPRLRNLSNATRIEIYDRNTQRVLYGEFRQQLPGSSVEAAHSAPLVAASGDAVGRAEIELVRHPNGALVQEFEVDVAGLLANAAFDVSIDGAWVGAFLTDAIGAAELEQFGRVAEMLNKTGD
jgi:hypothetical protein